MIYRKVSISILLAIALGMTACGGGNKTPTPSVDVRGDETVPVFAENIVAEYSMQENGELSIVTVEVTDENIVAFSLGGSDKDYFELTETKTRSAFSTTLKFKQSPNYEVQSTYVVSIIATDSKGNSSEKEFSVALEDKPFVFDVTGNMGSTVEGQRDTLILATKEAKDAVNYEINGDDGFDISENGDEVIFTAPDYNASEGGNNTYTATVTANDGNSSVILTVRAIVIADGSAPVIKTYLLKRKTDVAENVITEYSYNNENYLLNVTTSRGVFQDTVTYGYSGDYSIMRGYNDNGVLESIRVFESKNTSKNKFAVNSRLSIGEDTNYIFEVEDTVAFKHNRHMTKYIYGLDRYRTTAEQYVYNVDDTKSRILEGIYTISSEDIGDLSDAQLHGGYAPVGGFPSSSDPLNSTQLSSIDSGVMAFEVSQENTYQYNNNGSLMGIKFFGYGTTPITQYSIGANVSYYADDTINVIISGDTTFNYNTDSLLNQLSDPGGEKAYSYSSNDNNHTVTVTDQNSGQIATIYIFEEE